MLPWVGREGWWWWRLISLRSPSPRHTTVAPVVVNEHHAAPISQAQAVCLRGNEWPFLKCFYMAVPLQCHALETGGECSELVMRFDFMVVRTAVYLHVLLSDGQNMCVCFDHSRRERRGQEVKQSLVRFLSAICSMWNLPEGVY